jgi:hypothetical protein
MLIEYEFYYNLENMIAKPSKFTKLAGRITRIITNKELTLSGYSGDVNVYIDNLDLSIFNLLNKGDIFGITITHDSSICIAHDLALLTNEGFMEVDTPLLHPFQVDSTSRPIFAETATYDGLRFTLASSPELYLKKLLVSGFDKVFTIN